MSNQVLEQWDLTSGQEESLEVLWNNGGEIITAQRVADFRDTSDKAARRLLKRIPSELINIEEDPQGNIYSFTDTGRTLAREMFQGSPYGEEDVPAYVPGQGSGNQKRLHAFTVQAQIVNSRTLSDNWMGVLQEKLRKDFEENGDSGERAILKDEYNDFIVAEDTWVIRFHKDSVTFQLRDGCSIYGGSSQEVVRKAHSQAREIGSWVESVADVDLQLERFLIQRSELAFEEHPLAELADDLPGVPLSRFEVVDQDIGKTVLAMDASPGKPELESKSGEQAERVAQNIERELQEYTENPEALEFRHSFEREASIQEISGQEAVHSIRQASDVKEQMGTTVEKVSQVEKKVSEMKQLIKSNAQLSQEQKKTQDAVIELVRSNQNVIQELKDEVVSQESSQSYDDPVQEIFMEYWEDPEWNRPFFRDASGGGEHLCCFRNDGSDFEVILKADTVRRLRK